MDRYPKFCAPSTGTHGKGFMDRIGKLWFMFFIDPQLQRILQTYPNVGNILFVLLLIQQVFPLYHCPSFRLFTSHKFSPLTPKHAFHFTCFYLKCRFCVLKKKFLRSVKISYKRRKITFLLFLFVSRSLFFSFLSRLSLCMRYLTSFFSLAMFYEQFSFVPT